MSASDLIERWAGSGEATLDQGQAGQLLQEIGIPLDSSQARPGIELRLALEQDPLFGPVIALSYGRMAYDIWDDVTYRVVPLDGKDARVMIKEPRAAERLLPGYRDAKAPDVKLIEQALLKLSELAQANPKLAELELDSVMAYPDGLVARSAHIRLTNQTNV